MSDTRGGSHDRWADDAAAYALGALPEGEVRAFEEHLAGCRHCQDELARLRDAVAVLPAAAPVLSPAPELKQRVMAGVAAEEAASAGQAPRSRVGLWSGRRPQLAVAVAAVAAVLVVVGLLTLGGGSSTHTFTGVAHAPGATAAVLRSGSGARLRFSRMPTPPPGRIYQVWLQRPGGAPQPTRTLFAASTGSVALPGNLRGVQTVLVTAEPRPHGSRVPTRAPIIVVQLS
jgi:anti-sigma-K factor RskA